MPRVAAQTSPTDVATYANNWEYLSDRLRCLDLSLHQKLLKQSRARDLDPLAPLKELVISDAEISDLLERPQGAAGASGADPGEQRRLQQAAAELELTIQERCAASRRSG